MEVFGRLQDGSEVHRHWIGGHGLRAAILDWGGIVQDLRLDGFDHALVLGFAEFEPYLTQSPYFGANAGPCANRIGLGQATIAGAEVQLDTNFLGKHHLHGGAESVGKLPWRFDATGDDFSELSIELGDGHMGYPGPIRIRMRYEIVAGPGLRITYRADTDKPTLMNLAHHSYFNLDGSQDVRDHILQVDADRYLPVDEELIPTGEVAVVEGTPFDFRLGRRAGDQPFDHNMCLSDAQTGLRQVARLTGKATGLCMTIETTEPGLQIYDGRGTDRATALGLNGDQGQKYAGVALEPQLWPDAINHEGWASPLLMPGETYRQETVYRFQPS